MSVRNNTLRITLGLFPLTKCLWTVIKCKRIKQWRLTDFRLQAPLPLISGQIKPWVRRQGSILLPNSSHCVEKRNRTEWDSRAIDACIQVLLHVGRFELKPDGQYHFKFLVAVIPMTSAAQERKKKILNIEGGQTLVSEAAHCIAQYVHPRAAPRSSPHLYFGSGRLCDTAQFSEERVCGLHAKGLAVKCVCTVSFNR